MNRANESALLEFCSQQWRDFDARAWETFSEGLASRAEVAAVAAYLAGAGWFGHEKALDGVARRLSGRGVGGFPELARAADFEPSRFAGLLKARMLHARAS